MLPLGVDPNNELELAGVEEAGVSSLRRPNNAGVLVLVASDAVLVVVVGVEPDLKLNPEDEVPNAPVEGAVPNAAADPNAGLPKAAAGALYNKERRIHYLKKKIFFFTHTKK